MLRATFASLALAATCEAYVATGGARSPFVRVARQRCASPLAGLEIFNGIIQGVSDAISDESTGFGALNGKNGFGRKLGFGDQRTVRASHILFSFEDYPDGDGEAMADALKAKIEDGTYTFEFVAEKFSACSTSAQGGDMGEFKRGEMVPQIDELVFKVEESRPIGSIQGPIKTSFGHHLVKVVERSDK